MIHGSQLMFIECDFPVGWFYWGLCYLVVFLAFFTNFYIKEYIQQSKKTAQLEAKKKAN
jgi:elongation of very long chain fatty acids protein 7